MSLLPDYRDAVGIAKKAISRQERERNAELREEIISLREENAKLHETNRQLREQLERKNSIGFESGHYWVITGNEREGPYCPSCKDAEDRMIHLHAREPGAWRCPTCDGFFPDAIYRDPGSCTVLRSDFDVFDA